ncbi:hypothetical protein N3K66_003604 [Trichothecium roseum]|uniref:Uncharacterized protein n=1 Tax=Trichothecium roseum TaxID=47278 RepID=A0ACC0V7N7_9HYPO|nr:hypothetical protein N3K66_003604 [Trichothecium roseum]
MMDPTTLAPYTYKPLPTDSSIRLITRLGTGPTGHLRLSLSTHDLDTEIPTPFHCLSYTWGNPFAHGGPFKAHYDAVADDYSPKNKIPVEVDGRLLYIQKSLHDALTGLPESPYLDVLAYANSEGFTRMHAVAEAGRYGLLYVWASRGVDFNTANRAGRLPIHYSAERGDGTGVAVLARAGSRRNVRDGRGKTPRDLARENGHDGVVEFLDGMSGEPDPAPRTVPRDENGPERYVWADAVCINQGDVDEKTGQVSMMDRIYSAAACVAAWLGPADDHTEAAVKGFDILTSHREQFAGSAIVPYGGDGDEANYERAGVPRITREQWDGMASVYQRQWFRRAWIVQEAVLPELLGLYVGRHLLSPDDVGAAAETIRERERRLGTSGSSSRYVPRDEVGVPVEWNAAEFGKWRANLMGTKSGAREDRPAFRELFTLGRLLGDFRTFFASEPRDKVFAVYGLTNVFASERARTDYRRSVAGVYTQAARRLVRETGSLEVLLRCYGAPAASRRVSDLPGWVPDWSTAGGVSVPSGFRADDGLRFVAPRPSADDDDPVLGVRGLRVGQVSQVGGRVSEAPGGKFMFDPSWLKLALSLREEEEDEHAAAEDEKRERPVLTDMLWRTLCMNTSSGGFYSDEPDGEGGNGTAGSPPEGYAQQFGVFMMLLIASGLDHITIEAAGGKPGPHIKGDILIHIQHDALADMESSLADLDALQRHDGERCLTPSRADVAGLWDRLEYTLLRITPLGSDEGPVDFTVPPGVREGRDRLVGCGVVVPGTRIWRRCGGFAGAYGTAYGGRQLFVLGGAAGGRKHLGLAPVGARVGDEVWVVPGAGAPLVLRRREGRCEGEGEKQAGKPTPRFDFVGAAYVHGLMHGEGVRRGDDDGGVPLQDIELV